MNSSNSDRGHIGVKRWLDKQQSMWAALLVAAFAFFVYANSLLNGFVTDDPAVILQNPALQGSPISLFQTIDTISDSQLLPFYRPLTYLTFYVEGKIHGFNPYLMHLFNVILHALNAFLVCILARSIFNEAWPAFLVGILFAVHPIHSESVNFLSGGRNTMLAALFVLLALLAHWKSLARGRSAVALWGASLFFGGLLSKETAMMVLPIILVAEAPFWRRREKGARMQSVLRIAPYFAVAAGYMVLRWMTLSRLGTQTSIVPGFGMQKLQEMYILPDLAERITSNIYILPKYFLTMLWPVALSPRYAVPIDLHILALPLTIGWLFIVVALIWLLTRGRSTATLLGIGWFVAFWFPVSGIFPTSSILMAERYLYLPAIGLWIVVADQAANLRKYGKRIATYAALAGLVLCVVLSGMTIRRNREWKNEISLFSRMVEQYPENSHGYFHLGIALLKRRGPNDLQKAEKSFEMLLALDPDTQSAQAPLGAIRLETGDYEGALQYYSQALMNYPLDIEARINRAITYEKLGRYKEALSDYQFYLAIPGNSHVPGALEYARERIRTLTLR